MWGRIPAVDRFIYATVEYSKNNSDKSRKGFRNYLSEKYKISPSQSTINRWLSNIETNHHLPAFALAPFFKYYNDPDNKDPKAPSALSPFVHIAQEAGYGLFPLDPPEINGSCLEFFQAVAKNQKESADVISVAAEAIADGDLSPKELEKIQVELLEQLEAVSILITMVNGELDRG